MARWGGGELDDVIQILQTNSKMMLLLRLKCNMSQKTDFTSYRGASTVYEGHISLRLPN